MNCPTCKNPIKANSKECEWCGNMINEPNQSEIKILFFTAKWCGPCKMVLPIIQNYNIEKSSLNIEIVDVDVQNKIASDYGIKNIPALIAIKNQMIVGEFTGTYKPGEIEIFIKSNSAR